MLFNDPDQPTQIDLILDHEGQTRIEPKFGLIWICQVEVLNWTRILIYLMPTHTTYSWNIKWQKCEGMGLNDFIFKKINEN